MKIAIGTDHRGFDYKELIKQQVMHQQEVVSWIDVGTFSSEPVDYPLFAKLVCELIKAGTVSQGILLCASGVGMAVAANRFAGIYAAVAWNEEVARASRTDDDSNILVIPADFVDQDKLIALVEAWLATPFKGGKYQRRISTIDSWGGL
jgi:ribose 5-phosphate isomerase B